MMIISFLIVQVYGCPIVISSTSKLTNRCDWLGQIELYTHHPFLPTLVQNLSRMGIRTCAVYLLESQFMEDRYKFFRCGSIIPTLIFSSSWHSVVITLIIGTCPPPFPSLINNAIARLVISGVLSAMSAMVNLEIPWINIMSKMDLVTENSDDPTGSARNGPRGRKNIARLVVLVDHVLWRFPWHVILRAAIDRECW